MDIFCKRKIIKSHCKEDKAQQHAESAMLQDLSNAVRVETSMNLKTLLREELRETLTI